MGKGRELGREERLVPTWCHMGQAMALLTQLLPLASLAGTMQTSDRLSQPVTKR